MTQTLDEAAVIKDCVEELNKQLPDNKPIAADKLKHREGSVDLLRYLSESQRADAAQLAQQCPLIASDDSAIRWTVQRKVLAPASVWQAPEPRYVATTRKHRQFATRNSIQHIATGGGRGTALKCHPCVGGSYPLKKPRSSATGTSVGTTAILSSASSTFFRPIPFRSCAYLQGRMSSSSRPAAGA